MALELCAAKYNRTLQLVFSGHNSHVFRALTSCVQQKQQILVERAHLRRNRDDKYQKLNGSCICPITNLLKRQRLCRMRVQRTKTNPRTKKGNRKWHIPLPTPFSCRKE